MTIKEIMRIFEEQISDGRWNENDKVLVLNIKGDFDTIDFFLKDSDGNLRIYSI